MKKKGFIVPFLAVATSLSSCIFSDDGSWKEEYGTPELFLSQVQETDGVHPEKIYLYEDSNPFEDTHYLIKEAILNAGPFEEAKKNDSPVERFFTYEAYKIPATSGPNYCHLSIYEDGYVTILHKASLGPYSYVYFSLNAAKAAGLVDLVFSFSTSEASFL